SVSPTASSKSTPSTARTNPLVRPKNPCRTGKCLTRPSTRKSGVAKSGVSLCDATLTRGRIARPIIVPPPSAASHWSLKSGTDVAQFLQKNIRSCGNSHLCHENGDYAHVDQPCRRRPLRNQYLASVRQ